MSLLCSRLDTGWLPSLGFTQRLVMWWPSVLENHSPSFNLLSKYMQGHTGSRVLGWWASLKLDQHGVHSQDPSHQPHPGERSLIFFLVRKPEWQKLRSCQGAWVNETNTQNRRNKELLLPSFLKKNIGHFGHGRDFIYLFWSEYRVCGILVPWPGSNLCPLQWKYKVLTTGPPGKFPLPFFLTKGLDHF